MRIYTRVEMEWNPETEAYEETYSESYEYDGPIAEAKGGGGGGTTIQKQEPWAQAQPYYERAYASGEQALRDPMEFYGGNTVAGFNPNITGSQDWLMNYANGQATDMFNQGANQMSGLLGGDYIAPNYGAGQDAMEGLLTGSSLTPNYGAASDNVNSIMSGDMLYAGSNPYLKSNVNSAIGDVITQFKQDALPSIRNEAMFNGQYGGSRQGIAEGKAYDSAMKNAMNTAANMYGANYDTERQRMQDMINADQTNRQSGLAAQMNAIGQYAGDYQTGVGNMMNAVGGMGDFLQTGLLPGQIQGDIGTQQREYEQAKINEDVARHDFNEAQTWAGLQNMAALLNGGNFYSNSSVANTPSNNLSTLLGAGLTAGGLLA